MIFSLKLDYNYFYKDFLSGYHGPSLTSKFLKRESDALEAGGYTKDHFKNYETIVLDDSTFRYFTGKNKILITYYSLQNKNLLGDIQSKKSIAIATRCVFFNEYKLGSLNPSKLKINNYESICFYLKN